MSKLNVYNKSSEKVFLEILCLTFSMYVFLDSVNPREIREKSILICGPNEIDHKYFTLDNLIILK